MSYIIKFKEIDDYAEDIDCSLGEFTHFPNDVYIKWTTVVGSNCHVGNNELHLAIFKTLLKKFEEPSHIERTVERYFSVFYCDQVNNSDLALSLRPLFQTDPNGLIAKNMIRYQFSVKDKHRPTITAAGDEPPDGPQPNDDSLWNCDEQPENQEEGDAEAPENDNENGNDDEDDDQFIDDNANGGESDDTGESSSSEEIFDRQTGRTALIDEDEPMPSEPDRACNSGPENVRRCSKRKKPTRTAQDSDSDGGHDVIRHKFVDTEADEFESLASGYQDPPRVFEPAETSTIGSLASNMKNMRAIDTTLLAQFNVLVEDLKSKTYSQSVAENRLQEIRTQLLNFFSEADLESNPFREFTLEIIEKQFYKANRIGSPEEFRSLYFLLKKHVEQNKL